MTSNNFSWHHSMLRIKDPKQTVPFYEQNFGFKLLNKYDFPSMNFSLYFMGILPQGEEYTHTPGSEEAQKFLWNFKGTVLEFTHNYGTEADESFKYNNGNVEPNRGFGHIALTCNNVYESCEILEKNGVKFQKKPDDGRMKGLAFALDPDGYWIEIIKRPQGTNIQGFSLNQTMLRIKDPKKSLPFYLDILGMSLLCERHFPDAKFSLYFLGYLGNGVEGPKDPKAPEAMEFTSSSFYPVLELTHNHGTELDPAFAYHNGNVDPKGFGHLALLCDDINVAFSYLEEKGVKFQKKPNDGKMKGLAFALDPDNYWIEVIPRGFQVTIS